MEKDRLLANVSRRLRIERAARHITQQEVGDAVGMSKSQVSSYENGVKLPTFETAAKFADFYGISLDELVGR